MAAPDRFAKPFPAGCSRILIGTMRRFNTKIRVMLNYCGSLENSRVWRNLISPSRGASIMPVESKVARCVPTRRGRDPEAVEAEYLFPRGIPERSLFAEVHIMQEESSSSEAMQCRQCRKPLTAENRIASISGSIMGDEHTDSYFLCPVCSVYTVVSWWDDFTGVETVSSSGPMSKQKGDEQADLIRKCDRPWDKKCRCAAHCAYFGGSLD